MRTFPEASNQMSQGSPRGLPTWRLNHPGPSLSSHHASPYQSINLFLFIVLGCGRVTFGRDLAASIEAKQFSILNKTRCHPSMSAGRIGQLNLHYDKGDLMTSTVHWTDCSRQRGHVPTTDQTVALFLYKRCTQSVPINVWYWCNGSLSMLCWTYCKADFLEQVACYITSYFWMQ